MLSPKLNFALCLQLLFCLMCSPCNGFGATVRHVTSTDDSNSPGTLRDAIDNARSGDTIDFQLSNCPCTIILSLGQLNVNVPITINGPGARNVAISGNGGPVMYIDADATTTISGLEIRDSSTTALATHSDTILNQMIFRRNVASLALGGSGSAIRNTANLLVKRSLFEDNSYRFGSGAAIYSYSRETSVSLQIVDSTFLNNSAVSCGAVSMGQGVVKNSTFFGNRAFDDPGEGYGGAICVFGDSSVISSTIVGNYAVYGGGILHEAFDGDFTLANSVVANNNASWGPDILGSITTSMGNNLVSNRKDSVGYRKQACDLDEQAPQLSPPHIYATSSLPILTPNPGSPLIDAILIQQHDVCDGFDLPATDARGITRPFGSKADIGAIEFIPNDDRIFCNGLDTSGCTALR